MPVQCSDSRYVDRSGITYIVCLTSYVISNKGEIKFTYGRWVKILYKSVFVLRKAPDSFSDVVGRFGICDSRFTQT